MATSAQVRNAHRRVDRFISEHGDELLRLPKTQQTEIVEDVYQGRGAIARAKLKAYGVRASERRSQTSRKSAATVFTRRRMEMSNRIARLMPKANRGRTLKNAHLFTRDDVNRLYRLPDAEFKWYITQSAREASVTGVVASPYFYR